MSTINTSNEKRFVSAQQVAELAGVSRSAVSRTFTEGASISEKTRQKVIKAAEQLGYHVNHLARGLHNSSNIVSLITTDINTPFQARLIDALTKKLQEINKVSMVINTKGDHYSVSNALTQTLNYRAETSIILSGQPHDVLIEQCLNNGQRVLVVGREQSSQLAEKIYYDNQQAAVQVIKLFQSQGCRNLRIVNSSVDSKNLHLRQMAIVNEANGQGIQTEVVRCGETSYRSGYELAKQHHDNIDGVFCVTDLIACGYLDGLREQGFKVPQDTIVVGFDDIEQASWDSYQLTTFSQPIDAVCEHIIERLQREPSSITREWAYSIQPIMRNTTR